MIEPNPAQRQAASSDAMEQELGEVYDWLWHEVTLLHANWSEYLILFGNQESVNILNEAVPYFARLIQDVLLEGIILHIARLTDPPKSGGKANLTVTALPQYIKDSKARSDVERLVSEVRDQAIFFRDQRNRYLAHRDLDLVLGSSAKPLEAIPYQSVKNILEALDNVINAVSLHYSELTTYFNQIPSDLILSSSGARSLLDILEDGLKFRKLGQ